jgi:hypothetical protein
MTHMISYDADLYLRQHCAELHVTGADVTEHVIVHIINVIHTHTHHVLLLDHLLIYIGAVYWRA